LGDGDGGWDGDGDGDGEGKHRMGRWGWRELLNRNSKNIKHFENVKIAFKSI